MMRVFVAMAVVAVCGCTQDFGVFTGDAGAESDGSDSDGAFRPDGTAGGDSGLDSSMGADAADAACGVSQSCLDTDQSCAMACGNKSQSCQTMCNGDKGCIMGCKNQESFCRQKCSQQCVQCANVMCDVSGPCKTGAGL